MLGVGRVRASQYSLSALLPLLALTAQDRTDGANTISYYSLFHAAMQVPFLG